MLKTCEGSYRDGIVMLDEHPEELVAGPVLVTFLPSGKVKLNQETVNTFEQAVNQARSLFRNIPSSRLLSDELIAERRKEASCE